MSLPNCLSLGVRMNLPATAETRTHTLTHTHKLRCYQVMMKWICLRLKIKRTSEIAPVCGADVLFSTVWVSKEALVRVDICERKRGGRRWSKSYCISSGDFSSLLLLSVSIAAGIHACVCGWLCASVIWDSCRWRGDSLFPCGGGRRGWAPCTRLAR